jgi:ABC-2 type transport system permease protein
MSGFGVLVMKELLEAWRTRRLPAIAGLFIVFVGIVSPLTARYLPEILKAALGSQLTIPSPTPTPLDAIVQVQKNLGQVGALAAIILSMGAVATEKDRGTAAFILTKPASRAAFIAAKLVVLGIVLGVATLVALVVAWAYTSVLFELQPIVGWLDLALLAWLALAVWGSITFLASTVSGSAMVAAGIGVLALLGLSLVAIVPQAARFLPAGLDEPARALAIGVNATAGSAASGLSGSRSAVFDAGILATAAGGCIAIVAVSMVLAWLAFRRQEL